MNGQPDLLDAAALFDRLVSAGGIVPADELTLASLLALNREADRRDMLSRLHIGSATPVRRLLDANGVPCGPPPPAGRECDPKEYDEPACCEDARNWVSWLKPSDRRPFGQPAGPDREGWCISGEFFNARVRYCPFCGRNLAAVRPRAK